MKFVIERVDPDTQEATIVKAVNPDGLDVTNLVKLQGGGVVWPTRADAVRAAAHAAARELAGPTEKRRRHGPKS